MKINFIKIIINFIPLFFLSCKKEKEFAFNRIPSSEISIKKIKKIGINKNFKYKEKVYYCVKTAEVEEFSNPTLKDIYNSSEFNILQQNMHLDFLNNAFNGTKKISFYKNTTYKLYFWEKENASKMIAFTKNGFFVCDCESRKHLKECKSEISLKNSERRSVLYIRKVP